MSRGDSLTRQLRLMQILETRRELTVADVARELEFTERTVYRDLVVLERIGVPIYQEKQGGRSRWRVVDGYQRRLTLSLSNGEAFALTAGQKLLGGLPDSTVEVNARSAWKKVAEALPVELRGKLAKADSHVSGTLGAELVRLVPRDVQTVVEEAVERGETLRFIYQGVNARTAAPRLVDGYLLHVQNGAIYLLGYCHRRRSIRTFRLDRIRAAQNTKTAFEARTGFEPAKILQGVFGPWHGRAVRVSLRFSASVAPLVAERKMHPSQHNQLRSDGGLDVTMTLPICPELVRWIIGWGECVQVVEPKSLADEVRHTCELAALPGRFANPTHAPNRARRTRSSARAPTLVRAQRS